MDRDRKSEYNLHNQPKSKRQRVTAEDADLQYGDETPPYEPYEHAIVNPEELFEAQWMRDMAIEEARRKDAALQQAKKIIAEQDARIAEKDARILYLQQAVLETNPGALHAITERFQLQQRMRGLEQDNKRLREEAADQFLLEQRRRQQRLTAPSTAATSPQLRAPSLPRVTSAAHQPILRTSSDLGAISGAASDRVQHIPITQKPSTSHEARTPIIVGFTGQDSHIIYRNGLDKINDDTLRERVAKLRMAVDKQQGVKSEEKTIREEYNKCTRVGLYRSYIEHHRQLSNPLPQPRAQVAAAPGALTSPIQPTPAAAIVRHQEMDSSSVAHV